MITAMQLASALRAAADALDGFALATSGQLQSTTAATPAGAVGHNNAAPAAAPANVTSEQLTGLIMPHISNQAIKDALGVAMRENGVANLPEAQPHQYGVLYAAFQAVLARFGIGGAAPAATAPAATSII